VKKVIYVLAAALLAITLCSSCDLLPFTISPGTTTPPTRTTASNPIQPGFTIPISGKQTAMLPSIADVVAKVKPSVVAINVEVTTTDIFGRSYAEQGAGSGWIIDNNGIIVTNNHVVADATKVTIVLDDGRSFEANPNNIATDSLADLAVIKINASGLPAATVGNSSQLRVGDWVVAIGNSLGQGIRATVGIVSQQSVSLEVSTGETLSGLVETDAAINPGNSGGPLVNMAGEVVGITSVKIAEVGVEGTGYAIGTEEAAPIIQQLVNAGYVTRPYLGVSMDSVSTYYVRRYSLSVNEGAILLQVVSDGPASVAGLQPGDVITRFEDKNITDIGDLRQAINKSQIGATVEITYWRGSTQTTTKAILKATPH
jgi:serine protease Do